MAHVTGGGIVENLERVLPKGIGAELELFAWPRPPAFDWLASLGVEEDELRRVFNVGLGYVAVVKADDVELALGSLGRIEVDAWIVGRAVAGAGVTLRD